ncbi:hypothetical protein ACFU5O_11840 [Streptomyces sp. NPDC057445]|uniref:hypothetical protein n=1 Tax=Streptomyces sp. NPDC057445 TaxID=3346136 RepID=UPI0036830ECC
MTGEGHPLVHVFLAAAELLGDRPGAGAAVLLPARGRRYLRPGDPALSRTQVFACEQGSGGNATEGGIP